MNRRRLLIASLFHYWRTHLAVLLGSAVGGAVICGALIVGDSVRSSLRAMSLARLGQVDFALSGGRFVTESLAARLDRATGEATRVAPALSLKAGLAHELDDHEGKIRRIGGVSLFGLDQRLWKLLDHEDVPPPAPGKVILNTRVAEGLGAAVGDEVLLNVEIPSAVPRESLLGGGEQLSRGFPLTVSAILADTEGAARFGLNPSQQIPPVAFANLDDLQAALDLEAAPRGRRNPTADPARVNSLFIATNSQKDGALGPHAAQRLTEQLRESMKLDDLGLRLVSVPEQGYLSLESRRMILGPAVSHAAKISSLRMDALDSPVYVYLVNELASWQHPENYAAYSVIAGIEFDALDQPAFGPFVYLSGGPAQAADEIVLNEFLAHKQLHVEAGDTIVISYFTVGSHGELPEKSRTFRISGIVKLEGTAAADRHLTPTLEGITDAETFSDWEQPFAMDLDRVTEADETYWNKHRATPKAFLPLEAAQRMFRNRFGNLTSYRVAIPEETTPENFARTYTQEFLADLPLRQLGLEIRPVKYLGLQAAAGTTSFTGLFIGFSLFIIIAAAILIGLLFRLGIEQRCREIGLLTALGFGPKQIRRAARTEALCVVAIGAAAGVALGVGYAHLMIYGLTHWWRGAVGTRFLFVDLVPSSLIIGFLFTLVMALIAVWSGMRGIRRLSPRALLAGQNSPTSETAAASARRAVALAVVTILAALLLVAGGLAGWIPGSEAFSGFSWQVVAFFLAGTLLLVGALALFSAWLRRRRRGGVTRAAALGLRNAARRRRRSVSTVALIASATFVLVAVAASQRDPSVMKPTKDSGNGGFLLLAESTIPLPARLDTAEGRRKLGMQVTDPEDQALLEKMTAISFRVRPGDNASCLNLYQTGLPTILGVPEAMIARGGFAFSSTPSDHPWQLLTQPLERTTFETHPEGKVSKRRSVPTIPVFGDANTLMYSLKKGVGDLIFVPNRADPAYALKVVGMFDGSVFQGMLLMSEDHFLDLYPERNGYEYFLIDAPVTAERELTNLLETQLAPYGVDVSSVAERIAAFLVVQNTYLKTFRALGGLGLLLGTFGLGTVMLRNVLERRGELALMRGIGFRNGQLARMVLIETAFLLAWGLVAGAVAALLAVSPHLARRGGEIPVRWGLLMLVIVAAAGLISAWFAARAAVRTPIVATLRSE